MKREVSAAAVAFVTCWLIGASGGCSFGDDCDCSVTPPPAPQGPLAVEFSSYDENGNFTAPPVTPDDATIEITAQRAVIRYQVGGETFEIAYRVSPR